MFYFAALFLACGYFSHASAARPISEETSTNPSTTQTARSLDSLTLSNSLDIEPSDIASSLSPQLLQPVIILLTAQSPLPPPQRTGAFQPLKCEQLRNIRRQGTVCQLNERTLRFNELIHRSRAETWIVENITFPPKPTLYGLSTSTPSGRNISQSETNYFVLKLYSRKRVNEFKKEVYYSRKWSHPNIINVLDSSTFLSNYLCILLPYYSRGDVKQRLKTLSQSVSNKLTMDAHDPYHFTAKFLVRFPLFLTYFLFSHDFNSFFLLNRFK